MKHSPPGEAGLLFEPLPAKGTASGREQTLNVCHLPKESSPVPDEPARTGFVGTDFWHAVEFSRIGCAPLGVSRPVVGQPAYRTWSGCRSQTDPLYPRGPRAKRPRSRWCPASGARCGGWAPEPAAWWASVAPWGEGEH